MAARLLYKLYKLLKASFNHPVPSPYLIIKKNISKFHYRDRSPIADSPPPIKNGCIRMKRKEKKTVNSGKINVAILTRSVT